MATFLLNWNPSRWPWVELSETVARVRGGDVVLDRWSSGKRTGGMHPGDRFFLLRQGVEPRGIIGSGAIASQVFQEPHWERDGLANYVRIGHETLIDPNTEPELVLGVAELAAAFPEGNFEGVRGSGTLLLPEIAQRLDLMWRSRYGRPANLAALPDEVPAGFELTEGAVRRITVNAYERNSQARRVCIEHWGTRCSVCGFDFEAAYGELGAGYIQVHHLVPLAEIGEAYTVDPVNDLRPVCPNCHAMLHRREPPLTIDALRQILAGQTSGRSG